ncbi:MAG: hypothetical protein JXQ90_19710 [Cyclobacteriaceae bacterium]
MAIPDHVLRIGRGRYIPLFITFGVAIILTLIIAGISQVASEPVFIAVLILFSPILPAMLTGRSIVEVDMQKRTIQEFAWVMGKRFGEKVAYDALESVFLNEVGQAQDMHSRAGVVHTTRFVEYVSFLKTADGKKIELLRGRDFQDICEKSQMAASKLKVEFHNRISGKSDN